MNASIPQPGEGGRQLRFNLRFHLISTQADINIDVSGAAGCRGQSKEEPVLARSFDVEYVDLVADEVGRSNDVGYEIVQDPGGLGRMLL